MTEKHLHDSKGISKILAKTLVIIGKILELYRNPFKTNHGNYNNIRLVAAYCNDV